MVLADITAPEDSAKLRCPFSIVPRYEVKNDLCCHIVRREHRFTKVTYRVRRKSP